MGIPWAALGQPADMLWEFFRQFMGSPWASYGVPLTIRGQFMGIPRAVYGQSAGSPWRVHGHPIRQSIVFIEWRGSADARAKMTAQFLYECRDGVSGLRLD